MPVKVMLTFYAYEGMPNNLLFPHNPFNPVNRGSDYPTFANC